MLRFSRLVRHPARKWSGSILTTLEPARGRLPVTYWSRCANNKLGYTTRGQEPLVVKIRLENPQVSLGWASHDSVIHLLLYWSTFPEPIHFRLGPSMISESRTFRKKRLKQIFIYLFIIIFFISFFSFFMFYTTWPTASKHCKGKDKVHRTPQRESRRMLISLSYALSQ